MTTFTSSKSRCDRIIALIDGCLADAFLPAGAGVSRPYNPSPRKQTGTSEF